MPSWLILALDTGYLAVLVGATGGALAIVGVAARPLLADASLVVQLAAIPPAALGFLLALTAILAVLARLVPTPAPGAHSIPSAAAICWTWHFWLQRVATFVLWRETVMGVTTLRWLMLRALRCPAPFAFQASSDALLNEVYLLRIGRGCMITQGTQVSGHLFDRGRLWLAPVSIGEGAALLTGAQIGPGCQIGRDAVIGVQTVVGPASEIGDGAIVGGTATLVRAVRVGAGARIGHGALLLAKAAVVPGGHVPEGAVVARAAVVGADPSASSGGV